MRVILGGEEIYSSSTKDFPNSLNREWVERPFLWRDIVPQQHVCSLINFARHMRRLQWVQIVLSPHKKVVRQHAVALRQGRPGDLCMTPRTCCMSVLAHGVLECPAGKIDRTPLRTKDRRSVCPRTAPPNPCWKRLSWQHSFRVPCLGLYLALARRGPSNGPGLIHRPESPLRGGVHDTKPRMEPSASARTVRDTCKVDPTEVSAKPLP